MIGTALRRMRTDPARWGGRPLSLATVASRLGDAGWPCTRSAVSRWERGERRLDSARLAAWLEILEATPEERAALLTPARP